MKDHVLCEVMAADFLIFQKISEYGFVCLTMLIPLNGSRRKTFITTLEL